MSDRSRLSKRMESQSRRNMVISITGIVVILFLVFKFGIPFITNVSGIMIAQKETSKKEVKGDTFVAPPVLDSLPDATNSAQIKVSGSTAPNKEVKVYVDGDLKDETKSDDKGNFSFNSVTLSKGNNEITTKVAGDKDTVSGPSDPMVVAYKSGNPTLSVDSPHDGDSFPKDSNSATIQGKTDPGNKVTVNDHWAIVNDEGSYSYTLPLSNGDNHIKIVAQDNAGNQTTKELTVKYSQ